MGIVRTIAVAFGAVLACLAQASPAHAGGPTAVTITGPGLSSPLVVKSADPAFVVWSNVLFDAGLLLGHPPPEPLPAPPAVPGECYVLVMDFHNVPTYKVELYPHASGGPHVFFPADQPRGEFPKPEKTGWYRTSSTRVAAALRGLGAAPTTAPAPAFEATALVKAAQEKPLPGFVLPAAGVALLVLTGLGVTLIRRRAGARSLPLSLSEHR